MPDRRWPRKSPSTSEMFALPTPDHYLVAHIDGGARGNPGPAGYGVFLEDEQGRPVAELYEYLGLQTNNYAEYNGLLAALKFAQENGPAALRVLSDSELMVKQIKGQYKVSSPTLKELYDRAKIMIRDLDWFSIEHVRRERNREADGLANKAMDRRQPGVVIRRANPASSATPPQPVAAPAVRECEGVVRDGRVVLATKLPEGARVRVQIIES